MSHATARQAPLAASLMRIGSIRRERRRSPTEGRSATAGALWAQDDPGPNLLDVFRARCEARAIMVVHGLMHIHDAVDVLQAAAVAQDLVAGYGQDAIQQIMAQAFGRKRPPRAYPVSLATRAPLRLRCATPGRLHLEPRNGDVS